MESRYAQHTSKFLEEFREKVQALPSVQLIQQAPREALIARFDSATSALDKNRVFWSDQLATFEAWRSIFGWRMLELLDASFSLRNAGTLVACAPVARAAFELAQTSLLTSARLFQVLKQITAEKLRAECCFSETFPKDIELAIFGTTIKSRLDLKGIQRSPKLSKSRHTLQQHELGGDLSKYYEILSDLAHPYWVGNRAFYRHSNALTIKKVCREYDEAWSEETKEIIDTVISWTAKAASNVLDQTALGLRNTRAALGDV